MKGFSYSDYDGVGLAQLVREKQIQPKELIEEAITRIETANPQLNAVIYKMYEQARGAALNEHADGNFAGVPMLLKNVSQEMRGEPLTSGCKALANYRAKQDSEYVARLKTAGFVMLGYTNTPEFGLMGITEPACYGATRNPWSLEHSPGGSSGGSGAAVAAGMTPVAGANDGGGSIRVPASYCGLFGLKPTRGRTPVGPEHGRLWQGAVVEHVLTRSVRDSAAILDVLSAPDRSAAFQVQPFTRQYASQVGKPEKKHFKFAFSVNSPIGTEVSPECIRAVTNTVKILESMGHTVVEKEAPVDGKNIAKSYILLYFGEVAASLAALEDVLGRKARLDDVEPSTWLLGILGKATSAGEFVMGIREWDKAAYAMENFHDEFDFYLTPTTAYPPTIIGELALKPLENLVVTTVGRFGLGGLLKKTGFIDQIATNSLKRAPFTQLANLTGQPAMTLPLHLTQEGLPVGVQFMAAKGREDLLFQLAGVFEQTEYWTDITKNPLFPQTKI
jgi:amidase